MAVGILFATAAIAKEDLAADDVVCEGAVRGYPAGQFYDTCQSRYPPPVCYEYIYGFMEGASMAGQLLGAHQQLFCPPAGHGNPIRVLDIVLAYMQAHPEERSTCGLRFMVTKALLTEWRCK